MAQITRRGTTVYTAGDLPPVGSEAPDCTLTGGDLKDVALSNWRGKQLVLNIFPSVDTPTCAESVRRFNLEAAKHKDIVIACISMDLPFAQKRFCAAEGIEQVVMLSAFRHHEFGDAKHYGVMIKDDVMSGLLSRAIVVIDANGKVQHAQQVHEVTEQPDYDAALAVCGK